MIGEPTKMCWIPNALTLSRLVLLLPVIMLFETGTMSAQWWAFTLFLAACITDALDGWAARRLNCAGNIGVFLDPLADKIFANVLLIYLACHHPDWIPLWAVLILLAREFAVQGFRSMAPCLGIIISTGQMNKLKLVFQLIATGTTMTGMVWNEAEFLLRLLTWISLGLALLTGIWSMLALFRENHDLWRRKPLKMERR
jgi:CDP-diacylglycerol--glycerol-3-phosphate 3-phosphatidyltransferase